MQMSLDLVSFTGSATLELLGCSTEISFVSKLTFDGLAWYYLDLTFAILLPAIVAAFFLGCFGASVIDS